MPWVQDSFKYSKWLLERIANSYGHIYDKIVLGSYTVVLDGYLVEREKSIAGEQVLIEYKADFDKAFASLGRQHNHQPPLYFEYKGGRLKYYSQYSRLQQVVVADIIGITDEELLDKGFYRINNLKGMAYSTMTKYLNFRNGDDSHS